MPPAFDVSLNNMKIKHTCVHVRREDKREPEISTIAVKPISLYRPLSLLLPISSTFLVFLTLFDRLPYVGTIFSMWLLELTPIALTATKKTDHIAVLTASSCIALFGIEGGMRQTFLPYPTYVGVGIVLSLQAIEIVKLRRIDIALLVIVFCAFVSSLLLRLVTFSPFVIQSTEAILLVLCGTTYAFLQGRILLRTGEIGDE